MHTRTAQQFGDEDAHFLQALANVIGAAGARAPRGGGAGLEARFRELADTTPR